MSTQDHEPEEEMAPSMEPDEPPAQEKKSAKISPQQVTQLSNRLEALTQQLRSHQGSLLEEQGRQHAFARQMTCHVEKMQEMLPQVMLPTDLELLREIPPQQLEQLVENVGSMVREIEQEVLVEREESQLMQGQAEHDEQEKKQLQDQTPDKEAQRREETRRLEKEKKARADAEKQSSENERNEEEARVRMEQQAKLLEELVRKTMLKALETAQKVLRLLELRREKELEKKLEKQNERQRPEPSVGLGAEQQTLNHQEPTKKKGKVLTIPKPLI